MKYQSSATEDADDFLKLRGLTSFLPWLAAVTAGDTLLYLLEARSPASSSELESSSLDSRRTDRGDLDEEIMCWFLEVKDSGIGGFSKSDDDAPFSTATCFRFRDDELTFAFEGELSGVAWLLPCFAFPSCCTEDDDFFIGVMFDFRFGSEATLTIFTVYFWGVIGVVPGFLGEVVKGDGMRWGANVQMQLERIERQVKGKPHRRCLEYSQA
jgi:hypothetical protein